MEIKNNSTDLNQSFNHTGYPQQHNMQDSDQMMTLESKLDFGFDEDYQVRLLLIAIFKYLWEFKSYVL